MPQALLSAEAQDPGTTTATRSAARRRKGRSAAGLSEWVQGDLRELSDPSDL